jgi:hypothetical protein
VENLVELTFDATGGIGANFPVQQNGPFTVPITVPNGTAWSLSVALQPQGELCAVTNGSGTIAGASVNDIVVSCSPCGGNQQPECTSAYPNAPCQSGYAPNAQKICVPCGGDEAPACSGGACNDGYTVNPARSVCVPCGRPGLLACGGKSCTNGVFAGNRCLDANATKAPELVVMCAASDFAGVVVDPQTGARVPMSSSPLTTLIPKFFTPSGSGTDNLFDYFTEVTYGRLDRTGTVVIPWTSVNYTQAQLYAMGRTGRTNACVAAAEAANPTLNTSQFVDFVAAFNCKMDGGNQNDDVSTDPYGLFTNFMAHEVTHSLGALHSERLGCVNSAGQPIPCDPWDEMSAYADYSSANSTWWAPNGYAHSSAVGLVAGNLFVVGSHLGIGILASSEVYTAPTGRTETVTLSAINRDELSGIRVVKIPFGNVYYTVELRRNTGWDNADPETAVLVHSVVGSTGLVTLIPKTITGDGSYTSGDVLTVGNATVTIGTIDTATSHVPITIKD